MRIQILNQSKSREKQILDRIIKVVVFCRGTYILTQGGTHSMAKLAKALVTSAVLRHVSTLVSR